jgi:uncharacterized membrane protein
MARSTNRRAIRWLRGELPLLVSSGAITSDNAQAIGRYYDSSESKSSFGFVLLASAGAALIGAGIILLVAHNWDDFSRATRTVIAFLPLVIALALAGFALMRRNESQPWRESVAIFDVAAVGTAISLISQAYQIQGTFANFMMVWLLLSIPIVYLFRTTLGAIAYIIGTVVWLYAETSWLVKRPEELWFWILLFLVVPHYVMMFRQDRASRTTATLSIFLVFASTVGLAYVAESTRANLGAIAYAGLFASAYLWGMRFFSGEENQRLHAHALLGGFAIGVTAIVLSFENLWHMATDSSRTLSATPRAVGIGIQLLFPIVAISLLAADYLRRRRAMFSIAAALMPLVTALAWIMANLAPEKSRANDTPYSLTAAVIFDIYALLLGAELIARGVRANSLTRANFGLLVIAVLAIARFFDSDLSFLTRGLGFIAVGAGFLVANVIFFKKQRRVVA